MNIRPLHDWPTDASEAIALQRTLAGRVRLTPLCDLPRRIAGLDAAFSRNGREVIAGVVLWDRTRREPIESHIVRTPCRFPYVPGLLSFRETPALLEALRKLRTEPEALICDAHGLAHPRRFGLACHVGLWTGIPTVGCAKSRLCGQHSTPAIRRGSRRALRDRGERIGTVLRTRDAVRCVYVSPGHLCDHDSAIRLVLACSVRYRLPEPTRLADALVARARREAR